MKKSHLATKANLGYDKCLLYLNWMEMIDLVTKEVSEDGFERVQLTLKSYELYNKKIDN